MTDATIQDVIDDLTKILAECRQKNSPLGFFASLYRRVTIRVRDGIAKGEFEDNARMEKLDVIFATRYINAYHTYHSGRDTTQSWMIAFKAAERKDLLIMQHLLLGMNAHINLDLGIAAVETVEDLPIDGLHNDFNTINALLAELVDDVQDRIGKVSPLFRILDPLAGQLDEMLVNFSINLARDGAWKFAKAYYITNVNHKAKAVADRDFTIARLAENVASPKSRWMNMVIGIIRVFESKDNSRVMDALG